jgi:hypothetical protein
MIKSLPGIRESVRCVIRGIFTQFHITEDSGFKEEGVGITLGAKGDVLTQYIASTLLVLGR